ncbi:hypothetical protein L484_012997 [Morus notabilis]|uniref:Uncharacterized protein n=1 Tax=Morus notabilis TaxID=981085 RepID=W9RVJ8_9ROSA|nr:hypothetical protein L484_012997 [Morus notabilis]
MFLEYDYMIVIKPKNKAVLEKLLSNKIGPQPTRVVEKLRMTTIPNQTLVAPRRSGRVSKLPDRYTEKAQIVTVDDGKEDPLTFKATMDDFDKEK